MKSWIFILPILAFGILQTTLLSYVQVFTLKPDLLLIGIVLVSLTSSLRWALFLSLVAGILKDVLGGGGVPLNSFLAPGLSFLVITLVREISIDSNVSRAALVYLAALTNAIIMRTCFFYMGISMPLGIFLRIAFLGSLYTAGVSVLVFKIAKMR